MPQQNAVVVNWRCRLTCVDLSNGHKMVAIAVWCIVLVNDFATIGWGKICSCAPISLCITRWCHYGMSKLKIYSRFCFLPFMGDTVNLSQWNLAQKSTLWVYSCMQNLSLKVKEPQKCKIWSKLWYFSSFHISVMAVYSDQGEIWHGREEYAKTGMDVGTYKIVNLTCGFAGFAVTHQCLGCLVLLFPVIQMYIAGVFLK